MILGKMVLGMGGVMDLVIGVKKVIVVMEYILKGFVKILNNCIFLFIVINVVDLIVIEMGVMEVILDGILFKEINLVFILDDVIFVIEVFLILLDLLNGKIFVV